MLAKHRSPAQTSAMLCSIRLFTHLRSARKPAKIRPLVLVVPAKKNTPCNDNNGYSSFSVVLDRENIDEIVETLEQTYKHGDYDVNIAQTVCNMTFITYHYRHKHTC